MSEENRKGERICKTGIWCGFSVVERDLGELVRCADCINWNEMPPGDVPDWCPVVRKCTRPTDWCCWGARKGESDER